MHAECIFISEKFHLIFSDHGQTLKYKRTSNVLHVEEDYRIHKYLLYLHIIYNMKCNYLICIIHVNIKY